CPKFVINDWLTHLLGPSVTMAKVNRMLKKLTALGLFLKPSLSPAAHSFGHAINKLDALLGYLHDVPDARARQGPRPRRRFGAGHGVDKDSFGFLICFQYSILDKTEISVWRHGSAKAEMRLPHKHCGPVSAP
ncbi:hypothetical protein QZM28_22910, partial [Burkholderia multivorans]|nr:hypothetical protein [Burkholderia multivorans]